MMKDKLSVMFRIAIESFITHYGHIFPFFLDKVNELLANLRQILRRACSFKSCEHACRSQNNDMTHELITHTEETAGSVCDCRHIDDLIQGPELVQYKLGAIHIIINQIFSRVKGPD